MGARPNSDAGTMMDEKSLEMLEFPKIREILAGFASFSRSRELALQLRPGTDTGSILPGLGLSAEARHLLSIDPDCSVGDARDVRDSVRLAARGKVLEPEVLVEVRSTLSAGRLLRRTLAESADGLPLLWGLAQGIVELPRLEERIGECLTPKGEVTDTASNRLADLRYRLKERRQSLLDRLEGIIRSDGGRRFIQDAFIDERDGRYVLPVKVECQREIRGIVHDVSNTGATVFVEPMATVEMGNEMRHLAIEEQREVETILADLSSHVGAYEDDMCASVELMAEIDLALAKGRYASQVGAVEPSIGDSESGQDGRILRLVNARHPLLRGKAVPLSVEIGRDYSGLVITGPNTGGKTVALKTIGLLTLMAQSGLPIPASEGSCVPVFDGIYVDIGDEQSIERTLSTFSWHMSNIVRIVGTATGKSMVLLDEMGASTDPTEGAALARAILLHFVSRGTMVVATTHYSELKAFAHSTPGLQNASFDFDPVTLAPTYHLTVGVPGGSNALAVATRLGLPVELVKAARELLPKGARDVEELLSSLAAERQSVRDLRLSLESEAEKSRNERMEIHREKWLLQEGKQEAVRQVRDRVASEAAELQALIREAEAELKKQLSRERVQKARQALASVREQLRSEGWRISVGESSGGGLVSPEDLSVGDEVWLPEMETWATVLTLPDQERQLDVMIGQTRMRLSADEIAASKRRGAVSAPAQRATVVKNADRSQVSNELDLRGKRADEVEPELESYLDSAGLDRLSRVRIIHGHGTGIVRQMVRSALASHPLVKSYRPGGRGEGGDGVTIVEL